MIAQNNYNYLSKKYKKDDIIGLEDLEKVHRKYYERKLESIANTIVDVFSLNPFESLHEEDPLVLKALKITNPNFNPTEYSIYTEDQLMGITNSAKGKYFELLVAKRLNDGEQVGEIFLRNGEKAVLADSLTQKGWDLQIIDEFGEPNEYLQLKATDQLNYIKATIDRYPSIKILTTEEITNHLDEKLLLASGVSNEEITKTVMDSINDDTSFVDEFDLHFNPLITVGFILATQGYKLVLHNTVFDDKFLNDTSKKLKKSLIATCIGAGIYPFTGGLTSMLMTIGIRTYYEEKEKFTEFSKNMKSYTQEFIDFQDNKDI
jgi:hypothetical protein